MVQTASIALKAGIAAEATVEDRAGPRHVLTRLAYERPDSAYAAWGLAPLLAVPVPALVLVAHPTAALALLLVILRSSASALRLRGAHDVTELMSDGMRCQTANGNTKDVTLCLLVAPGLMVPKPISAQTYDAARDTAVSCAYVCATFALFGCGSCTEMTTADSDTLNITNAFSASRSSCAEINWIQPEITIPADDNTLARQRSDSLSGWQDTRESSKEERAQTLAESVNKRAERHSPFPYSDMRAQRQQARTSQASQEDKVKTQARRRAHEAQPEHVSRPEGRREKRKRNRFCRWGRTNDYLKKSGGKCIDSAKKRPPRHVRPPGPRQSRAAPRS